MSALKRYVISVFLISLFLCGLCQSQNSSFSNECHDCARRGVLLECTAFDPANRFSYMCDETGHLTEEGEAAFYSSQFTHLAELCAACSNCFHFQMLQSELADWQGRNSDIEGIGSGWSFPEYGFKIDLETGLSAEETHPVNGRPVVSRLEVKMYFLGEQEELVHTWTALGTLNTDRTGQTTYNGLNNQLTRLIKDGAPYNVLAWSFEKKPDQCQVKPEKDEVGEGQEIDIVLSEFRDALQQPSREFNRIIVHACEGRILNGGRCEAGPDYRVFRLDEQPITVRYRAPKSGDANSDKVTIYNSCEILPLEKSPLRVTTPHEEIATCDLRIKHYAWNGSLSLEVTRRFQCNVQEKASEIRHEEIRANDEHIQKVNITIGMDDFDLAVNPSIPGTRLLRDVSGEMTGMINEDHFTATRLDKTECYNESGGEGQRSWKWVSPGSWSTKHETSSGQASRTIKKENINLLIVKDIELNKDAMQNLQQQMMEAAQSGDMAAVQTLKGQMVSMVQGEQNNNTIPIRIRMEIVFDMTKKDNITRTFYRQNYNVCKDSTEVDSGSNTSELSIALPMGVEMKGTYTKGKDGSDIINASVDITETTRGKIGYGKCPDATIKTSGHINLERKRK